MTVTVDLSCTCGARISGPAASLRIRRIVAAFAMAHAPDCGEAGGSEPASPTDSAPAAAAVPPGDVRSEPASLVGLTCASCGRTFGRPTAKVNHEKACKGRPAGREAFLCGTCDREFPTRAQRDRHEAVAGCVRTPTRPPAGRPITVLPGSSPALPGSGYVEGLGE